MGCVPPNNAIPPKRSEDYFNTLKGKPMKKNTNVGLIVFNFALVIVSVALLFGFFNREVIKVWMAEQVIERLDSSQDKKTDRLTKIYLYFLQDTNLYNYTASKQLETYNNAFLEARVERNTNTLGSANFEALSNVTTFAAAFMNCRALATIPEGLFSDCSSVTTIPKDIFSSPSNKSPNSETISIDIEKPTKDVSKTEEERTTSLSARTKQFNYFDYCYTCKKKGCFNRLHYLRW